MIYPKIAILGAGTIGMSWAALFAATGRDVVIFDPADVAARGAAMMRDAAPTLRKLGWDHAGDLSRVRFTQDAADAVRGADFIQESVPERMDIKHALYADIAPHLGPETIIGSSTSGLKLSEMQAGLPAPSRLIIAHPFNPPHLIPLVELMANERTAPGVLDAARAFYESIGKTCVTLNKEVTGHIANRLQAALWREAIHLAAEGVASVEDIDKAVTAGPGLRWGVMGPTSLFHLGGGAGGLRHFCAHIGAPMEDWWRDLGAPHLTPEVVDLMVAGATEAQGDATLDDMAAQRDALILQNLLSRKAQG